MMIGIDTNILVRFITEDDKLQYEISKNLIAQNLRKAEYIFISDITLCELIWVLESRYKYNKIQLLKTLKFLISIQEFAFTDNILVYQSIKMYENGKADFADYLNFVVSKKARVVEIYSFDTKAIKEGLFTSPI